MKTKSLTIILLFITASIFSQDRQLVSVNLSGQLATDSDFGLGTGISYEEQQSKHHGYEFGFIYRNKTTTITQNYFSNQWSIQVRENYLNIPLMYKFYTKYFTLSTGLNFDCFLGGSFLTNIPNIELTDYDIDPKLYIGWNFKIGKEIQLSPKFILEPEIYFNPIFNYNYSYYGTSIKLKYRIK